MMSRKRRLQRDEAREGGIPAVKSLAGMKLPKNMKVMQGPIGVKMSDVLLEFADPYIESWDDENHLNKVLTMAMVAWDTANMPIDKRADAIEACMQTLPEEIRADGRAVLDIMMNRKEMHFADNKRAILSYNLTMTSEGPHVDVVSTTTTM